MTIKGQFLNDSLQIGVPVQFVFYIKHQPKTQILLPDSTYNFFPFELRKRTYFTTKTEKNISTDSVVYDLVSFEVQPKLFLKLPIWLSPEKDSVQVIWSKPDSIAVQQLVKNDYNPNLKSNTIYQESEQYFNYPYWVAGIIVLILVILLIWSLLGKRIIKAYTMFQFNTRHSIFLSEFARLTNRIKTRQSLDDIEKAITIWKKHLEQIENKPYSSYTSKEINQQLTDAKLVEALKNIDRAVYGQEISEIINEDFLVLRRLSINRFEIRKEQLRGL
ncbi:MAG: hypothetical protein EAZ85_13545 [Bacteroidetes bacterium]|nr:MAG: hypothetical protein EAZ85_13545 [Bacteroidota bacterium]TAG86555.1 MAG: hypothetical protein EAZ20_12500 [Bacteroidota bacterium]